MIGTLLLHVRLYLVLDLFVVHAANRLLIGRLHWTFCRLGVDDFTDLTLGLAGSHRGFVNVYVCRVDIQRRSLLLILDKGASFRILEVVGVSTSLVHGD